jgi:hypothetical protein
VECRSYLRAPDHIRRVRYINILLSGATDGQATSSNAGPGEKVSPRKGGLVRRCGTTFKLFGEERFSPREKHVLDVNSPGHRTTHALSEDLGNAPPSQRKTKRAIPQERGFSRERKPSPLKRSSEDFYIYRPDEDVYTLLTSLGEPIILIGRFAWRRTD